MQIPVFNQQDPQWAKNTLGTGQGYTLGKFGCAITCMASLAKYYGRDTNPDKLNVALTALNAYAPNGEKNPDGSPKKTMVTWGMLARVYGEILLERNLSYAKVPADMNLIDAYLVHGKPVIVGVSFLHKSKDTVPSHYVLLYKKNDDGTYQCMDPWYGDATSFNRRYAVNGMSAANAILQVVAYSGPVPKNKPEEAPITAQPQQAVTPDDVLRAQAESNYNLYLQEVEIVKEKNDRIQELERQVHELQQANHKLLEEVSNTKTLNSTLATHLADIEKEDASSVEEALKIIEKAKENEEIVKNTAELLKSKPTLHGIFAALDSLFDRLIPQKTSSENKDINSIFGIQDKEVR